MNLSNSNSIRYGIMNALTGEFLTSKGAWTACVFDANMVTNRDDAKAMRTQARKEYAHETSPAAIDIVRVRADVRRASLGRPRNVT